MSVKHAGRLRAAPDETLYICLRCLVNFVREKKLERVIALILKGYAKINKNFVRKLNKLLASVSCFEWTQ